MKLGLVGCGIVGNAFYEGMRHAFDVVRFDKNPSFSDGKFSELADVDGPIFVCVPTPMKSDGSCDTSIVESVVDDLARLSRQERRVVVIKSTIPPGTVAKLRSVYGKDDFEIVFNPEFLTEANPVEDFKNQDRIIVGGVHWAAQLVVGVYDRAYPNVPKIQCGSTAAEMVKYVANCFLATKVAFANEMYQICEKLGIDYNNVINIAKLDDRLGKSHWKVPGPMMSSDGSGKFLMGYSGSCFPKDVNALIKLAEELGVDPKVLRAGWEKNLEVRPERDWEKLRGRAISESNCT